MYECSYSTALLTRGAKQWLNFSLKNSKVQGVEEKRDIIHEIQFHFKYVGWEGHGYSLSIIQQ